MVAIFTGAGLGFERGSGAVLGSRGQIGSAALGTAGGAVAVNAATGALTVERIDEMLIGRGPDQVLNMTYNSLGSAWMHGWIHGVYTVTGTINTAGSTVTMIRDFNDRPVFTYDTARGAYVSMEGAGAYDELRYTNGQWSFLDGDTQAIDYFERIKGPVAYRSRTVDADGNTQTYAYGVGAAEVTRITNADGSYAEIGYANQNVTDIRNYTAAGVLLNHLRYTWDTLVTNRVLSVTVDLTPQDDSVADGKSYVTQFTYDGTSLRIQTMTQTDGSSVEIGYDTSGRVTSLTELVAAGVNRVTTLAYYSGYTTVTDAQNAVTTLSYDAQGRLTQVTLPPASTGASPQTTSFAYNANGDVVSVTDAAGNATSFQYDANGNEVWRQDTLGNVVTRTYGTRNQLLTETRVEASALTFTTNGFAPTITGDKILGTGLDNPQWGSATSVQTFTGSAVVSGRRYHPYNGYSVMGLTDGPLSTNEPWKDYDFAFYFWEGSINIWENGSYIQSPVPSGATDDMACQIEYDGATVVYRIGGAVVRTVAAASGLTFRAGVSANFTGRGVQDFLFAAVPAATIRYVYDSENHLRYVIGAEGEVTEYRYDAVGQRVAQLDYAEHSGTVAGIPAGQSYTESAMNSWVSWLSDKSSFKRTNTYYDARGQVSSVVTYSSLSKFGEGTESPLAIVPGPNITVTQQSDGLYRIAKTSGSDSTWDGDAHSLTKAEGDFVLQVRPGQTDKPTIGGMSAAPAGSASYTNIDYGFYFAAGGTVCFMEKGVYSGIGSYAANDNFWLERVGSTITYYKGATLAAAKAAGALRTKTAAAGALYFDSSIYTTAGFIDVGFTPLDIVNGVNTGVTTQEDGLYRVTKLTGGTWDWNADARSTSKAEGDFVLRLRPSQTDRQVVGGVATAPGANSSSNNADYGFLFQDTGVVHYIESGTWSTLGINYKAGDNFWLVRTGSTINYYGGVTLESAIAAGTLRTRTGVSGTYYFDSSFLTNGASMDVAFTPSPIVNGANTTITSQGDGLQRVVKSGTVAEWDADARSTTRADSDFVLRLRPAQTGTYMMGGVSAAPGASSSFYDLAYAFYFMYSGDLHIVESGTDVSLGTTYAPGDNFWLVRTGNSIGYYRGATLEAAMAAGALRTTTGVSGTFHFDSTIHTPGAAMDVAFTPTESAGGSAAVSRTDYIYDPAGRLLSRVTDGQQSETFVYDGLGRLVGSTDRNQGTTSIVFNDASNQTVVTLASGLVQTSTYNKAGNLISVSEGGSYVAGGTATSKYDKLGRLRMTTDAAGFNKYFVYDKVGRLVAEVNHRGDLTEYRYDANDRLVSSTRYTNPITGANLTALADPNSTIEMPALRPPLHYWDISNWRTYDKEGRLTSTIDATIRTYEYDKAGRLIKTVAYYNALSWDQAIVFQTSPPTSPFIPAADSRDSIARNFYDKEGRLVAVLDGEGYLTRNIYDRAGQLVEKVAYFTATATADRASGTLAQLIAHQPAHADDRRTRFVYDGQGQLRYEIDALNRVTEFGYNRAQQLVSTIRHAGTLPTSADDTYDNVKGLVAALRTPASLPSRKSWNVYDGSGRLAYSIDPEGAVVSYGYDNRGQVTKTVQFAAVRATAGAPDVATMNSWAAAQSGNAANRVTRNYYNARGEVRYTVDAEGYVGRTDFDAAGRTVGEYRWDLPISVNDASTIGGVEAAYAGDWAGKTYGYAFGGPLTDFHNGEGNWTAYGYYNNGTRMLEFVVFGDEAYTYFTYDNWGHVVERYDANGAPEGATVHYGYDGHDNLASVADPRNLLTTRTFDHLGRLKTETDPAGGIVTYEHNAFGDVTKVIDARGNATIHTYDQLGRLKTTTDALNNVTSYVYDEFGDLRTVTRGAAVTSFEYDLGGRVIKTVDAEGYYEAYGLNAFGERISVRNKIGGITVNSYDRRGLLATETLPMASVNAEGAIVATTVTDKFEYDSRGNRTKKIEAFGLAEARTTIWVYDKADRLIETRGDSVLTMSQSSFVDTIWVVPTEKLKYDTRSRVIEKTDALGGRTLYYYDRMSRVKAEIGPAGTYSAFTYDADGNMLTRRVYGTAVALPAVAGGTPPLPPAGEYRETGYEYDMLNRLKTSRVTGIRTGAWNGSYYETVASATVTTTFDYDSNGNVVRTVDGNNNASFAFYDKLDRKIAEVDREGYLTYLTLDGEGNVVWEQRYATALTGVTTTSNLDALRAAAGEARSTEFIYDKNGRRRFERRYAVQAYSVDPASGVLSGPTAVVAIIEYSYNGLGEILRKTEANGDYVDYEYDQAGRLKRELRAPFADLDAYSVRPTIDYSYNGLNALTRTRQGGEAGGGTDRVTRYYYGAGGRTSTMIDANGAAYYYYYDAAGNVVRESYYRSKGNGSSTLDSLLYTRDQLGRVTAQVLASWTGSAWDKGDTQTTAYNAYGDVAQRGLNGLWQEQLYYDSAGRVWKSNSGDGVWRFFLYDGAGNQTLTIESEGTDLAGHSLDQALALATANFNYWIGTIFVDGINTTVAQFDRRGQQTVTRLPFRELSGSTTATLTSSRTYDAYGEATAETDTRGYTTNFVYNAMGRLIEKQSPSVAYTTESGATGAARPVEKYYYDVSGRLIATEDANGNRVRRALVAGTGHGGSEALVAAEFHADAGVVRTYYDVFGDARKLVNEVNEEETRSYDAMGRLTAQTHHGLTDHYSYDLLGQRISHWNSLLGSGNLEITDYDVQGRVTAQVAFGGDSTQTAYSWSSTLATAGMATYGGWTETNTYANSKQSIEKSDRFGRVVWRQDLGDHVFASSYDAAGRLYQRVGPETLSWSYYNTGLAYSVGDGAGSSALYGYDAAGNKIQEYTVKAGIVVQNAFATYDELGRMKSWGEYGGAVSPGSSTAYDYDLVGNIRHSHSVQAMLDVQGANIYAPQVDYWYRFDAMNRVTADKGALSNGAIVGGTAYTYDAAGRRKTSTTSVTRTAPLWKYQKNSFVRYTTNASGNYPASDGFTATQVNFQYTSTQVETYNYDGYGQLQSVAIAVQDLPYYDEWGTNNPQPGALGAAVTRAVYTHDAMGRTIAQSDYLEDGTTVAYSRSVTYNAKSQVTNETSNTRQGTDTWTSVVTNAYGSGAGYALGAATVVTTTDSKNGAYQYATTTTNSFAWWDGAVQETVSFARTGATTSTSTYSYGGSGQLASISVVDGVRNRTITFTTDMLGQVIRRDEADAVTSGTTSGDPHEIWYRYNGRQIAYTGNNGTLDTDYAASIAARTKAPVGSYAFRNGDWNGPNIADYDPSLEHINSYSQGSAGGGYVVRAGDTLQGIALGLWGDASLWYKLAEANGLSGAAGLIEGRSLIVPAGVQANQHNASTLKPYDPSDVLGDTSPTTPKPQKKGKCGMFGQILLVAIAVAVSVVTYGALTTASTGIIGAILAGAASSAAGSIVSQGFGVATGIQAQFSWKAVGLAAISGAVGGGLGKFAQLAQTAGKITGELGQIGKFLGGSGFINGVARSGLSNVLTQGISVAVGLQKKFDFVGVAVAALGGGVGNVAGNAFEARSLLVDSSVRNIAANAGTTAASAFANAAARSLLTGTDFGDNIISALPQILGDTIGNLIAAGVQSIEIDGVAKGGKAPKVSGKSNSPAVDDLGQNEIAPGEAALPEGKRLSPQDLERVIEERRRYNVGEIDNDLQEQRADHPRAAADLKTALAQAQAAQSALDKATGVGAAQAEIRRLTTLLDRSNSQLAKARQVVEKINNLQVRLKAGMALERQLIDHFTGTSVTLGSGNSRYQYTIRGLGYSFNSTARAARDGIALAFAITSATGDVYERYGHIDLTTDGKYAYDTHQVGYTRYDGVPVTRPTWLPKTAAIYHIHPRSESEFDFNANKTFGVGDIPVASHITAVVHHNVESYLGASDGSFKYVRIPNLSNWTSHVVALRGSDYFKVPGL
jgi:YD repeat-containing protein